MRENFISSDKLSRIVNESINRVLAENSQTKRKYINRIYKLTSNYTSHKYHDNDWSNLHEFIDAIGEVPGIEDVNVSVDNGGYREHDGAQWKEYLLDITTELGEVIKGTIKCHFCGTMEDPTDAYDMTLILY